MSTDIDKEIKDILDMQHRMRCKETQEIHGVRPQKGDNIIDVTTGQLGIVIREITDLAAKFQKQTSGYGVFLVKYGNDSEFEMSDQFLLLPRYFKPM